MDYMWKVLHGLDSLHSGAVSSYLPQERWWQMWTVHAQGGGWHSHVFSHWITAEVAFARDTLFIWKQAMDLERQTTEKAVDTDVQIAGDV